MRGVNGRIDNADPGRDTSRPMGRLWGILVAAAVLLTAVVETRSAAQNPLPEIGLVAGEDAPALAPYVRYSRELDLPGPSGIADALTGPMNEVEGTSIHFGPGGQRTLVALKVRNVGSVSGSWILTTGRGTLSHFQLYELDRSRLSLLVDGTDGRQIRENLQTYQAFSTEVVLDPGQARTYLIDFRSDNSTYMPLRIETYGTFFADRRANIALVSGVVLGMVVLIIVNFMFLSITGLREFGWLALAQALFVLNTVHAEGYLTIFLFPTTPLLGVVMENAIKCAFAIAMVQFGRSFLQTRERFPRSDLALRGLIAAGFAVILLQSGVPLYGPGVLALLNGASWLVTVSVALFLPFIGFAAMRRLGSQLWPLFVGWASLALFIVYAAVASAGLFAWLPINWHLAGPVGLFESIMVTLALGLNLRKIQRDKQTADANYAASMAERLEMSERAARLAEEKAFALATVNSQNALLHASGHDSRQVILALNSAVDVLRRNDPEGAHRELTAMLSSSADYLGEIASTTMSGASLVGSDAGFLALSAFRGEALIEPLMMMFRAPFAERGLTLTARVDPQALVVSDRPVLMRALANLVSNSYHYTVKGGAEISLELDQGNATIRIVDTGAGIPPEVIRQLGDRTAPRLHGGGERHGTGSGFRTARRIVEALSGTLEIAASGPEGTELLITLPCAHAVTAECSVAELGALLPGWHVLDFDQRAAFTQAMEGLPNAASHTLAATYDDTTVTRGRLSETVAMMLIKPLCREMAHHPAVRVSEQV
jgi:signal transduction histidine kinase